MRRRQVLLLSMLAVLPALAAGSGSFSAVTADRGLDARVVDDERAYLGIEVETPKGYIGGDPFPVVRLTDQLSGDLGLIEVETDGGLLDIETDIPAGIGTSSPLTVTARCADTGDARVPVTLTASGTDVSVSVDRAVHVTCLEPEIQSVSFDGCGGAWVRADKAIYPLSVTKVIKKPNAGTVRSSKTLHGDGKVKKKKKGGGKLVAVEADSRRHKNTNTCTRGGAGETTTTATQATQTG